MSSFSGSRPRLARLSPLARAGPSTRYRVGLPIALNFHPWRPRTRSGSSRGSGLRSACSRRAGPGHPAGVLSPRRCGALAGGALGRCSSTGQRRRGRRSAARSAAPARRSWRGDAPARAARAAARPSSSARRPRARRARAVPVVGYLEAIACRRSPPGCAAVAGDLRGAAHARARLMPREARPGRDRRADRRRPSRRRSSARRADARALAEEGTYRRAVSTFPSLTPVCLSSLATGAHPDVHGIPHLVWYHREERRVVEYGSSFGAIRAAGFARSLRDTIVDMNRSTCSPGRDAVRGARGRGAHDRGGELHLLPRPHGTGRPARLPGRERAEALLLLQPLRVGRDRRAASVRNRAAGTIDDYASAVGRWLVTRDGFDLLVHYLQDYDFASHLTGRTGRARRSCAATRPWARWSTRPAAWTSSSSGTRS